MYQLAELRESVLLGRVRRDLIKILGLLMGTYNLSATTRLGLC
jgi:hypothetical protein